MAKAKKDYEPMSIKLEKQIADRLRAYSDETSIPKTAVIEKALTKYLDEVTKKS